MLLVLLDIAPDYGPGGLFGPSGLLALVVGAIAGAGAVLWFWRRR